jgi:hypothetical protein
LSGCSVTGGFERYEYSDTSFSDTYYVAFDESVPTDEINEAIQFLTTYFNVLKYRQYPVASGDGAYPDAECSVNDDYLLYYEWPTGVEFGIYRNEVKDVSGKVTSTEFVASTYYPDIDAYTEFRKHCKGTDGEGLISNTADVPGFFTEANTRVYANPFAGVTEVLYGDKSGLWDGAPSSGIEENMYRLFLLGDSEFGGFRAYYPDVKLDDAKNIALEFLFMYDGGNFRGSRADEAGRSGLGEKYIYWDVSETTDGTIIVTQVWLRNEVFYPFIIILTAVLGAGLYFILRAAGKRKVGRIPPPAGDIFSGGNGNAGVGDVFGAQYGGRKEE